MDDQSTLGTTGTWRIVQTIVLSALHDRLIDDAVRRSGVEVSRAFIHLGLGPLVAPWLFPAVAEDSRIRRVSELAGSAFNSALRGAALSAELLRILNSLREGGLTPIAMKGPVLAQQIYGQVGRREYLDLDILVRQQDAREAFRIVRRLGYQPQYGLSELLLDDYAKAHPELTFQHPHLGVLLDLHWSLFRPGYSWSGLNAYAHLVTTSIAVGSRTVLTLGKEVQLLFMALHLAKHNWANFSWLVDFAALLIRLGPFDWDWILCRAGELRCARMLHVSLKLASDLFEVSLPRDLFQRIGEDRRADCLAAEIAGAARSFSSPPPYDRWYRESMETCRDRLWYWLDTVCTPTPLEWAIIDLPRGLRWGYYPIRIGRLIGKRLHRRERAKEG